MALYGVSIQIDSDHMLKTAQAVDTQSAIIENCLNGIQKDANALKNVWEGESANAYLTAMDKLGEEYSRVVNILKEYALDLNKIALQHMSDEQKLKAQNEALPDDIFGV